MSDLSKMTLSELMAAAVDTHINLYSSNTQAIHDENRARYEAIFAEAKRRQSAHDALLEAAEAFITVLDDERGFDPYAAAERKAQLRAALEGMKEESK